MTEQEANECGYKIERWQRGRWWAVFIRRGRGWRFLTVEPKKRRALEFVDWHVKG